MYRVRSVVLVLCILALTGLFNYELAAKSPRLFGDPVPGWHLAHRVENATTWNEWTGLLPLDKLLHEGQEAVCFYYLLLTRPTGLSGLSIRQIGQ